MKSLRKWLSGIKSRLLSYRNISELAGRRDISGLVRALKNPDINVQYEAVSALGELDDPEAVEPLVHVLRDDQYSAIRWRAAESLAKIGEPAIDPLIECLSDPAEDVRWKAAVALGMIGDERAVLPLISLLSDHDRFVRSRAAVALGQIGHPAVGPLISTLSRGDGYLRWGAVIALGQIPDPGGVVPLLLALSDKYEDVRSEAISALTAWGDRICGPFVTAFEECTDQECSRIVAGLGEPGCEGLLNIIRKGLGPEGSDLRIRFVAAVSGRTAPALWFFARGMVAGETRNG